MPEIAESAVTTPTTPEPASHAPQTQPLIIQPRSRSGPSLLESIAAAEREEAGEQDATPMPTPAHDAQTPAQPSEPTPATPETPTEEPAAAPAQPSTPETPAEEAEETARVPKNLKISESTMAHDPHALEIIALAKRAKMTLEEAADVVNRRHGIPPKASAQQPQTPAEPAAPKGPTLDEQIATARTELKTALDLLDNDKAEQLREKIADLKDEKRVEEIRTELRNERQQATVQQQKVQEAQASMARAVESFPALTDENSELATAVNAEWDRLERLGSPLLTDPDFPEALAAKIAVRMGIAPKAKGTTPAAPATPAQPAAAPAKPASVVKPATNGTPKPQPLNGNGTTAASQPALDFAQRKALAARNRDTKAMAQLAIEEEEAREAARQPRR